MRQGACVTTVIAESAVYACIGGRFGDTGPTCSRSI